MGRILTISSQTVYGPVGNSAAVPALQTLGHEVLALPTILLSHHPGHGKPTAQQVGDTTLSEMWRSLSQAGVLNGLDAILTGYFANAAQVVAVAEQLALLRTGAKGLHILVDPVIGDHGRLYVPEAVAEAIRDHLLPLATITTPNLFELEWLSRAATIPEGVAKLGVAETLVTSVPRANTALATMLFHGNAVHEHVAPQLAEVPHGTGDYLAAAYLGERLAQPPEQAFKAAMSRLQKVIAQSAGSAVLKPHIA